MIRAAFALAMLLTFAFISAARLGAEESKLDRSLKSAAGYGNTEEVKELLSQGADPNSADKFGKTALFSAVRSQNLEVVKLLIEAGGDVNAKDRSGESLLSWCRSDVAKIRLLLDAGAKPDDKAVDRAGTLEAAELLLAAGGNPQAGLSSAAQGGNMPLLEFFIKKGAKVGEKENGDYTALHVAALQGGPEAVEVLLKHGADPNATDKQLQTPLHMAVSGDGDPRVVKLLVDAGAKLNVVNNEGFTPVRLAGSRGAGAAYQLLLDASGGSEPALAKVESDETSKSTADLLGQLASQEREQRLAAQRELVQRGAAVMPEVEKAVQGGAPVGQFFELFTALGPDAKSAIPLIEEVVGDKEKVLSAVITLQRIKPGMLRELSEKSQASAAEALGEVMADPESDVYGGFAGNFLASMGPPATPTILKFLRHESPGVRAGMARMLARVKGRDPQIKEELEKLTGDDDSTVRTYAAEALARFSDQPANNAASRKSRDALIAVVKSPPPFPPAERRISEVSEKEREYSAWQSATDRAARSLGQFGPEVIDELLPVLTPYDHPNRMAAITAIKNMDESAVPRLIELLKSDDEALAGAATMGLVASRPASVPSGRPFSDEERLNYWAENPQVATRALLELASGDQLPIRQRAVNTLGQFGVRAAAAAPKLTSIAGNTNEPSEIRCSAANAMLQIDKAAARQSADILSCIALLVDALEKGSYAEQVRAAKVLKEFGPVAKDALPMLRQRLQLPPAGVDTKPYHNRALQMIAREAIEVIEGRRDDRGNQIR